MPIYWVSVYTKYICISVRFIHKFKIYAWASLSITARERWKQEQGFRKWINRIHTIKLELYELFAFNTKLLCI